MLAHTRRKCI